MSILDKPWLVTVVVDRHLMTMIGFVLTDVEWTMYRQRVCGAAINFVIECQPIN